MTAIDKFIRLEAIGWWYEAGRQEAREVIVSFGDATLQLTSLKDVPLTHWALLATKRIGTRGIAVIYSADPEKREILEIEDKDMICAISAVSSALTPAPVRPGRRWLWRGLAAALVLGGLSQAGPLVYSLASTITPPARLAKVSLRLQDGLRQQFGAPCKGWQGQRALAGFAQQLFGALPPDILVFDGLPGPARTLPDETIILSRQAVEAAPSAESLALTTLLAWADGQNHGPKRALIAALGPFGALRYMITGRFPANLPAIPEGQINGDDYVLARDLMVGIGVSPAGLQPLAEANGIGLPLPPPPLPAFEFTGFATLQNICAE